MRHGQQHTLEARPAIALLRRKVRSAEVRLALRRQKRRQRPSSLSADRGHSRLITRIHIRPLIPIHLHRDEVVVQHRRGLIVLIALAVHHMAPVAPHRADIQQHRLVLAPGLLKGLRAPLMPLHRLMPGRPQIRRRRTREPIFRRFTHCTHSKLSDYLIRGIGSRQQGIANIWSEKETVALATASCLRLTIPYSLFPAATAEVAEGYP